MRSLWIGKTILEARRRIALVACPALLAGCSAIPPYPSTLPPLVPADLTLGVCPAIAGRYADAGIATGEDGHRIGSVSLTRLLHRDFASPDAPDSFLLTGPDHDVLVIESFSGAVRQAAWQQPKITKDAYLAGADRSLLETYLCQDGFVRVGRGYGVGVVAPGTRSGGGDFFWMRKAVDGSLVALRTSGNARPFDFLATDKFTRIWYLFPEAPKPTEGLTR